MPSRITGLICAVCATRVPLSIPCIWVCPNKSASDPHHVLLFEETDEKSIESSDSDSMNPFVRYREQLAVDAFGDSIGLDAATRIAIIEELDEAVRRIDGTGFHMTPARRADELSDVLDFSSRGGVWIKDETNNVAGSHKARHLFTELVYLVMAERAGVAPWTDSASRPPLAIASCGNAAIAASTLARAVDWPIAVHVPVAAQKSVVSTLASLQADVRICPRQKNDPAGDPCVLRFRELVHNGAIPFGVQGTENPWCLDGGRTLGWEMLEQLNDIDRVFIQVGGGAFAATVTDSYVRPSLTQLHVVQTEGCAPLVRAWEKWKSHGYPNNVAQLWPQYMWPWEHTPTSFADGILDDETYDWIPVLRGVHESGGSGVTATEDNVVRAHQLAHRHTDVDVSPTGSAGLAGLLQIRDEISPDDNVLVIFSGHSR